MTSPAVEIINLGEYPNDANGDPLRTAFAKCNFNFGLFGGTLAPFTPTTPGLVPASGGGTATALRADGAFTSTFTGSWTFPTLNSTVVNAGTVEATNVTAATGNIATVNATTVNTTTVNTTNLSLTTLNAATIVASSQVTIAGEPAYDSASGNIGYYGPTAAELSAASTLGISINTLVAAPVRAPGNALRYGCVGNNSTANDVSIARAIAVAVAGEGFVYFPAGNYRVIGQIVWANAIAVFGDHNQWSIITSAYTAGDQNVVLNPLNTSTDANYAFRDIAFLSTGVYVGSTIGFANFADTGSTFVYFTRVRFGGNSINLILDQTEVCAVRSCLFSTIAAASSGIPYSGIGVWLTNGVEHTPGASQGFTNNIQIDDECQFNGATSSTLIVDDGGASHKIANNNLNGGGSSIRLCGNLGVEISHNEIEAYTQAGINFETVKNGGGAVGNAINAAEVRNNSFAVNDSAPCLFLGNNAVSTLDFSFNNINCPDSPFTNINGGVSVDLVAIGNTQQGSGPGNTLINNYFENSGGWVVTWGAGGGTPSFGSSSVSSSVSRKGQAVIARLNVNFTGATFAGTSWNFNTPYTAATEAIVYVGSAFGTTAAGTAFWTGVPSLGSGATLFNIFTGSGAIGSTVPGTFQNGDIIRAELSYRCANWIG